MIVLDQYLELVRLSQLSIITNILTRQQQDMPVPAGVFCLGLSPQTCHQVEFINCDLSRALLLSRVKTCPGQKTGEETIKWLEGDGTRPSGVSHSSSPGTFHLSPVTAPPYQSALNNSDGCIGWTEIRQTCMNIIKSWTVHQLSFKLHRRIHKSQLSDDYDQVIVCGVLNNTCW